MRCCVNRNYKKERLVGSIFYNIGSKKEDILISYNTDLENTVSNETHKELDKWTCDVGAKIPIKIQDYRPNREFDCREKWGNKIMPALYQGECGSCWAFSLVGTFSDRCRIKSKQGQHIIELQNEEQNGNRCFSYTEKVLSKTNQSVLNENVEVEMGNNNLYQGVNFISPYYIASCQLCSFALRLGTNIGTYIKEKEICGQCCSGSILQMAFIFSLLNGIITIGCVDEKIPKYVCANFVNKICNPNYDSNCNCFDIKKESLGLSIETENRLREKYKDVIEALDSKEKNILDEYDAPYILPSEVKQSSGENWDTIINLINDKNYCIQLEDCPLWKPKNIYRVNPFSFSDLNNSSNIQSLINTNVLNIQAELFYNGPVSAVFAVYSNFLSYDTRYVYDTIEGDFTTGHAINIIGWGYGYNKNKKLVPYWLCRNTWGQNWGNNGYFTILRGQNFCRIEDDVWSLTPFDVYNSSRRIRTDLLLYQDYTPISQVCITKSLTPSEQRLIQRYDQFYTELLQSSSIQQEYVYNA